MECTRRAAAVVAAAALGMVLAGTPAAAGSGGLLDGAIGGVPGRVSHPDVVRDAAAVSPVAPGSSEVVVLASGLADRLSASNRAW